jgi:hypothetical protein
VGQNVEILTLNLEVHKVATALERVNWQAYLSLMNEIIVGSVRGILLTGQNHNYSGKNLSQYHFVHHNCRWPGTEPDLRSEKPVINRLLRHGLNALETFLMFRVTILERQCCRGCTVYFM